MFLQRLLLTSSLAPKGCIILCPTSMNQSRNRERNWNAEIVRVLPADTPGPRTRTRFGEQRYGPDRSICWESGRSPIFLMWMIAVSGMFPGPTWEPSRLHSQDDTITAHFQVSIWYFHTIGHVSDRGQSQAPQCTKQSFLISVFQILGRPLGYTSKYYLLSYYKYCLSCWKHFPHSPLSRPSLFIHVISSSFRSFSF